MLRRVHPAAHLSVLILGLCIVVYVAALSLAPLREQDFGLRRPQVVGDWRWGDIVSPRFGVVSSRSIVIVGVLALTAAVVRRRWDLALTLSCAAAAVFAVAAGLSRALASLDPTGYEALRESPGAFPSEHAAAAAVVGLLLIVALPRAVRVVAAALIAPAIAAMSIGLLALGWHYPSDIVGGNLLALAMLAAILATPAVRRERRLSVRSGVTAAVGALAVSSAVSVWALRTLPDEDPMTFVSAHPGFMTFCVGATLMSIGTCAVLAALLQGPRSATRARLG